jgi:hypothetical protein
MPDKSRGTTQREAVERIRDARSLTIDLPVVGRVRIPHPEQLAYFGALGVLAAIEIIDWPIALAIAAGHVLVQNQHNRVAEEVGEALEDA